MYVRRVTAKPGGLSRARYKNRTDPFILVPTTTFETSKLRGTFRTIRREKEERSIKFMSGYAQRQTHLAEWVREVRDNLDTERS